MGFLRHIAEEAAAQSVATSIAEQTSAAELLGGEHPMEFFRHIAEKAAAQAVATYIAEQAAAAEPSWEDLVPVFNAKRKELSAASWMQTAETAFGICGGQRCYPSDTKIGLISLKLKGRPAAWFDTRRGDFLPVARPGGPPRVDLWDFFREAFLRKHQPGETPSVTQEAVNSITQQPEHLKLAVGRIQSQQFRLPARGQRRGFGGGTSANYLEDIGADYHEPERPVHEPREAQAYDRTWPAEGSSSAHRTLTHEAMITTPVPLRQAQATPATAQPFGGTQLQLHPQPTPAASTLLQTVPTEQKGSGPPQDHVPQQILPDAALHQRSDPVPRPAPERSPARATPLTTPPPAPPTIVPPRPSAGLSAQPQSVGGQHDVGDDTPTDGGNEEARNDSEAVHCGLATTLAARDTITPSCTDDVDILDASRGSIPKIERLSSIRLGPPQRKKSGSHARSARRNRVAAAYAYTCYDFSPSSLLHSLPEDTKAARHMRSDRRNTEAAAYAFTCYDFSPCKLRAGASRTPSALRCGYTGQSAIAFAIRLRTG